MADPFTWGALATGAGAALSAGGTIMGANDAAQGAYANQRYVAQNIPAALNRGIYAHQQLQQQANETRAAATRDASMASRKTDYIIGAGRATAAASGGNATDTSVVSQLGSAQQQGDFEKLMSLYAGENKARGLEYEGQNALIDAHNAARGDLYSADSAAYRARLGQRNAVLGAGGTLLGAAGSLGTQYAGIRARSAPNSSGPTSSWWS